MTIIADSLDFAKIVRRGSVLILGTVRFLDFRRQRLDDVVLFVKNAWLVEHHCPNLRDVGIGRRDFFLTLFGPILPP